MSYTHRVVWIQDQGYFGQRYQDGLWVLLNHPPRKTHQHAIIDCAWDRAVPGEKIRIDATVKYFYGKQAA